MRDIRKLLRSWAYSAGYIESELDGAAEHVYATIAHELAEKIRQEIQSLKDHEVLEPDKDWAASTAADFIDPYVN